jgi:RPA family protein
VVSTIGAPIDVTAQELRVEAFFPADDETRNRWTSSAADQRASFRLTTSNWNRSGGQRAGQCQPR